MKFRNEDGLEAKVLRAMGPEDLSNKIEELCKEYDLTDLQYSTTTLDNGWVEYSALALVRKIV